MGSTHSKPRLSRKHRRKQTVTYPAEQPAVSTASSASSTEELKPPTFTDSELTDALSPSTTARWESRLLADPKNQLALSALATHAPTEVLRNPTHQLTTPHLFSHKISVDPTPVTNQLASGRCWLYAFHNLLRPALIQHYNLPSLELSASYLFFWDKLEKANWFLEQIIDTTDEDAEGRLLAELCKAPVQDGGQWEMVQALAEKYGVVPETVYKGRWGAERSGRLGQMVTSVLREAAVRLRELANAADAPGREVLLATKTKALEGVHRILVLTLGAPPKPTDTFTWNFTTKSGQLQTVTTTPVEFYNNHMSLFTSPITPPKIPNPLGEKYSPLSERLSLVHDPRHKPYTLLTLPRLGNVIGGPPIKYINVPISVMKDAAAAMIKADLPVFFGCDVGKFSDTTKGIGVLSTDIFNYELCFGTRLSLGMSKAQRLRLGESAMTHAMVLTGVHVEDGEIKRWRVENSWGGESGEKGYLVMEDGWMGEFCYQVVVDPVFVEREVREVLEKDPVELPLWDPMGALA